MLRNWDIPTLFGFPSAESLRIGSHVAELETLLEKYKAENLELRKENQSLKGDSNLDDEKKRLRKRPRKT